jgi:hypothetical protein
MEERMLFGMFELLERNSSLCQHPLEIIFFFFQSEVRKALELHFLPGELSQDIGTKDVFLFFKLHSFVGKGDRLMTSACCMYVCMYVCM